MESRLIIRKANDGINYKAVVQRFCGEYYDAHVASGATPFEAREALIHSGFRKKMNRKGCDNEDRLCLQQGNFL